MRLFLILAFIGMGLSILINRDFVRWIERNFRIPWQIDRPPISDGERYFWGSLLLIMGLLSIYLSIT